MNFGIEFFLNHNVNGPRGNDFVVEIVWIIICSFFYEISIPAADFDSFDSEFFFFQ